jgi:DNA repair exonuclease SbcCD ATPase subunit
MKFLTLTLSNFGSVGEMTLPLADQGLTLILGRNEDAPQADSNGAGKSLPLDAFTWALWGNTVRGFGSDEVVHNKVHANCKVGVSFSEGSHEYEVIRYRKNKEDKEHKSNDLILMCDGAEVSGASVAATQSMIEDIVGLDFTTFCAMMPGAGITVATMTDAEVKVLLERLLRTEALGKASEEARRRHRAATGELAVLSTRLVDLESSISEVEMRITGLQTKESGYADHRLEKLQEIDTAVASLEETKAKEDQVVSTIDPLTVEKGELKTLLEGQGDIYLSFKADIGKTNLHYSAYIAKLREDLVEVGVRMEAVDQKKNTLDGFGGQCHVCYQDVSPEHAQKLRTDLEAVERTLQIKIDTIEKSEDLTRGKWDGDKEVLHTQLVESEQKIGYYQDQITRVDVQLGKCREAKVSSGHLNQRIGQLTERKVSLEADANPYSILVESEEVMFVNKQQEHGKLDKEIEALRKDLEILDFWVDSFSPQGIRSFMLEHVTPLLNQFAKKYADIVTAGEMEITFHTKDTLKSGKSKERFNIQVTQKHGGGSYASNSSGERARANLIIALALGELAAMRADKNIPFRFLDEPFESIDEAGVEAIILLLNQQQEQYDTVFVITHQDHFKQLFPNKMTVVKKGGFSSLEKA